MMETHGQAPNPAAFDQLTKDSVLEINASHPIIVNLNQLRKTNDKAATLVTKQLLDNVRVQQGIPFDLSSTTDRQYQLIGSYLEAIVNISEPQSAQRATKSQGQNVEIEVDVTPKESAMKQARKQANVGKDEKVFMDHTFDEKDFKRK